MVRAGYKQTEVGEIPEDWETKTLSDLCRHISDGTHYTPKYVNNGIPFYSVENITANDFVNTKYISQEEHQQLIKRCRPERGDILMTRITAGIVGDTKLIDWDVNASIYVSLALLKLNSFIVPEYFYRYTKSTQFLKDVEKLSLTNATPKKINMDNIGLIPISVPNSNLEQDAIATALAAIDNLIISLENLIAKKNDIKTSTMQQLLTGKKRLAGFGDGKGYKQTELGEIPEDWEVVKLGNVSKIEMGQSPYSSNYNSKGIGLPLIQGNADIRNRKTIIRNYTSQITKASKAGDIILSVRAPVGEVAIAEFDCCIGRGVCAIRYVNNYLYHWLISFESSWEKYSKGSTFDSINSDELREIKLFFPTDNKEQLAIAKILSDIDDELATLGKHLTKVKSIKQGMMQELLTGRTRLPFKEVVA
jgi:type I restriction enzyme, S subunit